MEIHKTCFPDLEYYSWTYWIDRAIGNFIMRRFKSVAHISPKTKKVCMFMANKKYHRHRNCRKVEQLLTWPDDNYISSTWNASKESTSSFRDVNIMRVLNNSNEGRKKYSSKYIIPHMRSKNGLKYLFTFYEV